MVQSSRFLNEPGSAPAYSGVENSTASAAPIADRRPATDGASGSTSSSGLKCGNDASAQDRTAVTPGGATAAAVRNTAVFVEPSRRLPEIKSTRQDGIDSEAN